MVRSVGPLKAGVLLPIFSLLHHERWVCLKIHHWKGELNEVWTKGGVCLRGIFISNCSALLSALKHFLFKRVRKYSLRESSRYRIITLLNDRCSPSFQSNDNGNFIYTAHFISKLNIQSGTTHTHRRSLFQRTGPQQLKTSLDLILVAAEGPPPDDLRERNVVILMTC